MLKYLKETPLFSKLIRRESDFFPLEAGVIDLIDRDTDLIISFVRSGSRWLLCPILSSLSDPNYDPSKFENTGFKASLETEMQRGAWIARGPDSASRAFYSAHSLTTDDLSWTTDPRPWIVRSHDDRPFYEKRQQRVLYTCRSFPAVLASFWHYRGINKGERNFRRRARKLQKHWRRHVEAALAFHKAYPENILFITYGSERPFDFTQIQTICDWFEIETTPEKITAVLEHFHHLLDTLSQRTSSNVPRGTNAGITATLDQRYLKKIDAQTCELFERVKAVSNAQLQARTPN